MNCEQLKQLLSKYNITTLEELEYSLDTAFNISDECADDPEDKNCMNSKCYEEYGVPDCRKIVEIYNKYFQKEISKKDSFVEYLDKYTSKSKSSIANYLSCKSCNQQIQKGIQNSLKIPDSEFKKDFCNNLSIKFSYSSVFETNYISIKQFLVKEHKITSDTFVPIYNEEVTMTKDEEKKLFDIVHTSKEKFQENLRNEENLTGSEQYLFNLASYAFERGLSNEAMMLLERVIQISQEYLKKAEFLQLKSKLLSNQKKDKEAIVVLKELISNNKSNIDAETYNLLAASIKRDAFNEYEKYSDEKAFIEKLNETKDIYYSIYNLNKDYYPALNYIYLQFMLAHIHNDDLDNVTNEAKNIWSKTNHKITDWWSFISNVEYLILIGQYDNAKNELRTHFDQLEQDEITEFNISSTLRQLNLYYEHFCKNIALKNIIEFIAKL